MMISMRTGVTRVAGRKHSRRLWPVATTSSHSGDDESVRGYHATPKQEILPLIGVAAVLVIGRYSYKALQRMDEEWEDYRWELQRYEKELLRTGTATANIQTRTVAIDLGSVYTKLATSYPKPEIVATREGDRYFFNGLVYTWEEDRQSVTARGRGALERFYFSKSDHSCPVVLPWKGLSTGITEDILGPALDETLDRLGYNPNSDNNNPESAPILRSVVTLPSQYLQNSHDYTSAFANVASTFLPDPVASIWGAQWKSLIPSGDDEPLSTIVVDVGGSILSLSLVQKDIVTSSISLPWGGERWVELLVDLLCHHDEAAAALDDERSLAALQNQARIALTELSSKTRTDIHVPYLFPDPSRHHLEMSISRSVLEQALHRDIPEYVVPAAQAESSLSPHMPTPTDLSSLFVSLLTQLLESGHTLPTNVDHILLVGGASRAPVVATSLKSALQLLTGDNQKLVVPDHTLLPELTVLGAATMLPSYAYNMETGLEPIVDDAI